MKLADETISKFTVAQPTVHVPEGFEDYLLVTKNYQLHDNDNQNASEEVIWYWHCSYSFHYFFVYYGCPME